MFQKIYYYFLILSLLTGISWGDSVRLNKAYQWLVKQQVPNSVVSYPIMKRRYFLLSFELDTQNPKNISDQNYQYIYSRSSLYDSSLGVIAFTMMEDFKNASRIIDALSRNIEDNGLLWFTYNTHNEWPSYEDEDSAISRNGASAWAGYAVLFYLKATLLKENKEISKKNIMKNSELVLYLNFSKEIADFILKDQIQDKRDQRYGLILGGLNRLELQFDEKTRTISEKFFKGKTEWVSIEHNIDIYFFLRDLAQLTEEERYKKASDLIKTSLLQKAWNSTQGQFVRGVHKKDLDQFLALDCASWGSLFLKAVGDEEKAKTALKASEKYEVYSDEKEFLGHKPYLSGLIYEEQEDINKFYFPKKERWGWQEFSLVWPEGSLGVALAALKLGDQAKLQKILKAVEKLQTSNGGFKYASADVPYQFSTSPSVAGTAWYIIVQKVLENKKWNQLFWDK